ncbi:LOW QUALITY PROTEIN: A disintegrin and metalloproteinase with thrombospondin motifs 7 [Molothrus ater]|uniref:LOW QUALITY PROTEIN: A disintegrin and metalloproteinase with thrombospondin motifs 7 n=1 Tax=Molothrus ater TaxID=84834 RepID=UPI0023E7681D|nr:LOW QUALITY PROTEIN: A disintegrin and metalloproteinase with thrombospondin motifs 7 [Molothrus ater]
MAAPAALRPLLPLVPVAAALALAAGGGTAGTEPRSGSDIVHPIKVDESGAFLSYDLSHRALHRRSPASRSKLPAFYELQYRGQPLKFNLSLNRHLLAPGFVSERRFGGIAGAKIQPRSYNPCHMIGEVRGPLQVGLAALSTCDGLKGVFQLMNEDYFIEPVSSSPREEGAAQPHRIYKRQVLEARAEQGRSAPAPREPCGVPESQESLERSERRRERWEQKQHRRRRRRIKQRSISREKWVETLVVADTKMVEFHGSANIEKYVLTVMNMVAGLFHHASIGNPINIAIVRLILLEHEEEDLKISHHADNTLKSFCKWQKSINVKGDSHPLHHDVAVLLTRKDICAAMNRPCETLGLSHVAGMCQPHRSCNINEDTGLPLAFTVAHELGHSFGIQHDGSSNDCEPVGKRPFIMSPQLLYDTSPLTWSRCSREYITRFLDRGWGLCLDDPPARELLDFPLVPPGVLYDVGHQCRLQYGPYSTFCDDMDSVCSTLWCTVGNTCHSKLDAAVDGTACGESKWCFNGECVPVGFRPEPIDGGWSSWSAWASCSRSCGAGVQSAERHCSHPTPKYGGRYCLGERKRFRICNVRRCPLDKPSFRQVQCSQFNPMLYKGKLYKWTPVPNNMNPCELHCRPEHEYFAEKLRDAVVDGTPCYDSDASRDVCINGICKNVGCDYEIDSHAVEDRCGVCHGDGSTCHTVHKTFEDSEGLGYVDIGIIPVGAREIRIEEVAEAGNFLALRSEDPEKYFLNGGWTIQWNGDYRVAGTTFTYKRTGNWENLTSPGPTVEPVWIQLLFQETNPGVRYQYTIQRPADSENEIEQPEFLWRFGSWTTCTATCGTGVQRQVVHCVERLAGLVEERFCDALTRPDDQQRTCSEEPCPARWWVGEWQQCSATCGRAGLMKRTVLCIQSVGLDEQRALQPADCQHLTKPDATMPCHPEVPCPSPWALGNWSECSVTCGNGTQRRPVHCSNSTGAPCDPAQRPSPERLCSLPQCHQEWDSTDWSGSGSSSREVFNEIHYIPSNHVPKFNPLVPNVPESNDVNVITEEDFSARKGNVFVDDFYYDYNFINFHEDLSYYPFTEKESKGEEPKAELSTDGTEGPWELPTESLLTTELGGESQGQPGPEEEHTSAPVRGQDTEPGGDLASSDLLSMGPEDVGSATPRYSTPGFLGEQEEDTVPVPHSEHHPPTQSSVSPNSANQGQAGPWDEPHGAVPSRSSLGQDLPAPWGPHPADVGRGSAQVDVSLGPAARGSSSSSEGRVGTQGRGTAGRGHGDSREVALATSSGIPGAAPQPSEQHGWAGMPEGMLDTWAGGQSHGTERADLALHGPGWEVAGSAGSPHPALSPRPVGQGGHQPELHSPTAPTSTPSLATTAPPVPLSPAMPGPGTQLTSSGLSQQGGLGPAVPTAPAHGPPAHTAGPPREWGTQGVSLHPDLASRHTELTSHGTPLSIPAPRDPSPWAPPETPTRDPSPWAPPGTPTRDPSPWAPPETPTRDPSPWAPPETPTRDPSPWAPPGTSPRDPSPWAPSETPTRDPSPWAPPGTPTRDPSPWAPPGTPTRDPSLWAAPGTPTRDPSPWAPSETPTRDPSPWAPPETPTRDPSPWAPPETPTRDPSPWAPPETPTRDPSPWAPPGTPASSDRGQELSQPSPLPPLLWEKRLEEEEEEEEEEALLPPSPPAAAPAKPSWEVGNWSECSATCGLGAVWRSVRCSSGPDGGCPAADRPVPARRCSLRPCSAWRVGTWSKCSRSCGGGTKVRDVHCVDTRDQRLLRPFHCQAGLAQPPAQLPCHSAPCLDWYTSSWRECSEPCGGGEQARLVTCPEPGRCEESLRPNSTRPCNSQPCTTWVVGSWGQCSAPCGGGIQRRQVKCIDTRSGVAEEDSSLCDHEPRPESTQKCNPQECDSSEPGVPCERDRLSFAFCRTLRLLGRCPLPTVRAQCCRSCQRGQQRGQQRLSRR